MAAAEQFIYARVETAYSPKRFAGFQAVYRSFGLSAGVAKQIEEVVKDFAPPDGTTGPRLQFFPLADGRWAFAHSVGLPAGDPLYRTYVARDGRDGGFVTHCLVLTDSLFVTALLHPFRVFDGPVGSRFITDVDGLARCIGEYGERFTDCPPLALPDGWDEVQPDPVQIQLPATGAGGDLWQKQLWALVRRTGRPQLVIAGPPSRVADILRLAVRGGGEQIDARRRMTFDTLATSDRPGGPFWAVGVPAFGRPQPAGGREAVDATTDPVALPALPFVPLTRAEVWADEATERLPADEVRRLLPAVTALAAVLDGTAAFDPTAVPPADACREFYRTCRDEAVADAVARTTAGLPPELHAPLRRLAERAVDDGHAPWWRADPMPVGERARWVAACVLADQLPLGREERRAIVALGRAAGEWPLVFWTAAGGRWRWERDNRVRAEALAAMTADQFATAFRLLHPPVPAGRFFHPRHLTALVGFAVAGRLSEREVIGLIGRGVAAGRGAELEPLAGRVGELSAAGRRAVVELTAGACDAVARVAADTLRPPLPPYLGLSPT